MERKVVQDIVPSNRRTVRDLPLRRLARQREEKEEREAKRMDATRFMWIPGLRPVNVPIVHPSNKAMINSIIILL